MAFILAACGGIDGVLNVQQAFQLKDRKGEAFSIPTGSHKVNLKYKDSKHRLTVGFDNLNGEETSIEINTPESFQLPENGSFQIKAEDFGQSVDLNGAMSTKVTQSPERWDRRSCTREEYQTICQVMPGGQQACFQQPVSRPGFEDIRYYDVTTDQALTADFSSPSTAASLAHLQAHTVSTERHVISQGPCW